MPVLLFFLKALGVLLFVLALAVFAALFVPMRIAFEYRPGSVRVSASYGPLHRTLFARSGKRRRTRPPEEKKAMEEPVTEPRPTSEPARNTAPEDEKPQDEAVPWAGAETEESGTGRVERIVALAEEQPMALLRCLARHFNWMRGHAVCRLRVRHLDVFWTVTCEDAADTAMAFGAQMAAFNTLLAVLQQSISVQSDRLWLEPDFTGMRRGERRISFCLSACAILMFGLAYRLWKDPFLQPQPETAHT